MSAPEGTELGQVPTRNLFDHPPAHSPCVGPHVFVWRGSTAEKGPPEGLSCKCGMLEVHYSTCDCGCGGTSLSLCFKHDEWAWSESKKSVMKN
jgi:hypothetical protein